MVWVWVSVLVVVIDDPVPEIMPIGGPELGVLEVDGAVAEEADPLGLDTEEPPPGDEVPEGAEVASCGHACRGWNGA